MSILEAFLAGKEARRQADAAEQVNRMQQFLAQNGQAIFQGDQNALGALAGMGPQGLETAMSLRAAQEQRAAAEAERARAGVIDQRQDQEWQWKVEEYAASKTAAEREAEAAKIEEGVKMGLAAKSPEEWDMLVTQAGATDLVGMFDQREAVAQKFMTIAEILKQNTPNPAALTDGAPAGTMWVDPNNRALGVKPLPGVTPEAADEYQRYVQEEQAAGRQPLPRIQFEQAKKGKGFSMSLPDGTSIEMGGGLGFGLPPVGQNSEVTGTPRDGARLARNLSDQDATTLKEEMDRARAAEDLQSISEQMKMLLPDVGYTGFGGQLYGIADSITMDMLPGDGAARGSFESLAVDAQLTFIQKTKGAVTDQEMALFRSAVPGLGRSPAANQMMADILAAGAQRVQTRFKFMEEYASRNGSLEGSKAAWDRYMQENPLMERGDSGIILNPEGDYSAYLDKPASAPVNRTPTVIDGFEIEEVN